MGSVFIRWVFLWSCVIVGVLHASLLYAGTDHDSSPIRCLNCHVTLPFEGVSLLFHTDTSALCLNCHNTYQCKSQPEEKFFSHPVAVRPSFKVPVDMPLDVEQGMGCITCHFYHDGPYGPDVSYTYLLRRPLGANFCFTCHGRKLKK